MKTPESLDMDDDSGSGAFFELFDAELDDFLDFLNVLYVFHDLLLLVQ